MIICCIGSIVWHKLTIYQLFDRCLIVQLYTVYDLIDLWINYWPTLTMYWFKIVRVLMAYDSFHWLTFVSVIFYLIDWLINWLRRFITKLKISIPDMLIIQQLHSHQFTLTALNISKIQHIGWKCHIWHCDDGFQNYTNDWTIQNLKNTKSHCIVRKTKKVLQFLNYLIFGF